MTKETEDLKDCLEYKEPLDHPENLECQECKVSKATRVNLDCQVFLEALESLEGRVTKVRLVRMEWLVLRDPQGWRVRLALRVQKETLEYLEQEDLPETLGCPEFQDLKESLVCQE